MLKELVLDNHPALNECISLYESNMDEEICCKNLLFILKNKII
jgi:hypothetical protein